MANEELELARDLLVELRKLKVKVDAPLPTMCSMRRAAFELSMSVKQLKSRILTGQIAARVEDGEHWKVPAAEIRRFAETAKLQVQRKKKPGPRPGPRASTRTETKRGSYKSLLKDLD